MHSPGGGGGAGHVAGLRGGGGAHGGALRQRRGHLHDGGGPHLAGGQGADRIVGGVREVVGEAQEGKEGKMEEGRHRFRKKVACNL